MTREERETIEWAIWSLTNHPEEWEPYYIDEEPYSVDHISGARVWVANGFYGMGMRFRGPKRRKDFPKDTAIFGVFVPWRRRLRAAALSVVAAKPFVPSGVEWSIPDQQP